MKNSTSRLVLFGLFAFVIVVFMLAGFKLPKAETRTITFSSPMIAIVNDSSLQSDMHHNAYIFNKGSNEMYKLSYLDDDLLLDINARDSSDMVFAVKPELSKKKYWINYQWAGRHPDFSDKNSIEHYIGLYRVSLSRIDYKDILKIKPSLRQIIESVHYLLRPPFVNEIPDSVLTACLGVYGTAFFISLETKPSVMLVPDCYWDQDDVIKCQPAVVYTNRDAIEGEEIGINLGGYEVWESSLFDPKKYQLLLKKNNNSGLFEGIIMCKED